MAVSKSFKLLTKSVAIEVFYKKSFLKICAKLTGKKCTVTSFLIKFTGWRTVAGAADWRIPPKGCFYPLDTGLKFDVHKAFRRDHFEEKFYVRLIYVPCPRGTICLQKSLFWWKFFWRITQGKKCTAISFFMKFQAVCRKKILLFKFNKKGNWFYLWDCYTLMEMTWQKSEC